MNADRAIRPGEGREREWLEREVEAARNLTDAERVRILEQLVLAAEAIRRSKTTDEILRDDEARRILDEPGRARYRRLAEAHS